MEIRLLGPVELWRGGREISLGRPAQRCVLAILAVTAGQPVGMDQLLARLWGERLPGDARSVVYTHVSRLRQALEQAGGGRGVLRRAGGGYLLDIDPDLVDLHRARRLVDAARELRGEDDGRAAALLDDAASLWRGEVLAGLSGDWAERTREGVGRERLSILAEGFVTRLGLGQHAAVTGPLADLLGEHPLDESLADLLMLALYRRGLPAEALRVYADLRRRLVAELGVEPSEGLRRRHEQILRRDPALDVDSAPEVALARRLQAGTVVPAQLPADVAGFAGRDDTLKVLDELLPPTDSAPAPTRMRIAVVVGAAGVGKPHPEN